MKSRSLAFLAVFLTSISPLRAQSTDAQAVLDAASSALAQSGSCSADWVLGGLAPEGMFSKLKASGNGTVKWVRDGEFRVASFTGKANRAVGSDMETINFVFSPGKVTMLLTDKKTFVERSPDARPHPKLTTARKLMRDFWIEEQPFAFEKENAIEITLAEPETAGGETCDVVEITLPELTPEEKKATPRKGSNLVRVYIAQSDSLPRKVEFINVNAMGTFGESIELNDLRTGLTLTASDLLHQFPEGWRLDSTLVGDLRTRSPGETAPKYTPPANPGGDDKQQTDRQTGRPTGQAQNPAPATNPRPLAADFSFTTEDGRSIDNQTQRGRVTVLYFWGSWCMPCKEFSPLVSQIAANAAEAPLDVFGLAVRERDSAGALTAMAEGNFAHALVLEGDALASKFRVRVYPTIIVIDKEGRVVSSTRPEPGKSAEQTMTDVTNAIEIASNE